MPKGHFDSIPATRSMLIAALLYQVLRERSGALFAPRVSPLNWQTASRGDKERFKAAVNSLSHFSPRTDVMRQPTRKKDLRVCICKRSFFPFHPPRFLCLKNKTSALVVFTTYTQRHPSIERGPPFVQPLLNFIWFLLLAVDG